MLEAVVGEVMEDDDDEEIMVEEMMMVAMVVVSFSYLYIHGGGAWCV